MNNDSKKIEPGTAEWESVCKRCGRCCYEKVDYRERIFYTDKPCEHLDTIDNRCRIYAQRDVDHPDCARLTPELLAAGILPHDCPYVAGIENYPAPEMDDGSF